MNKLLNLIKNSFLSNFIFSFEDNYIVKSFFHNNAFSKIILYIAPLYLASLSALCLNSLIGVIVHKIAKKISPSKVETNSLKANHLLNKYFIIICIICGLNINCLMVITVLVGMMNSFNVRNILKIHCLSLAINMISNYLLR